MVHLADAGAVVQQIVRFVRRCVPLALLGLLIPFANCSDITAPLPETLPTTILLSSSTATFQAVALGARPAAQTINILNGSPGTLEHLSVGSITYGTGASGWLGATLGSVTAPAALTLVVEPGALPNVGSFTASVPIVNPSATNTPQTITVTVNVTPPPATQLEVITQPGGALSGVAFTAQPVVAIRDANGRVVSGATNQVSVSIGGGTGTLSGTTTVTAVNGIASFGNLRITGSGAHTLAFSSPGLAGASSASINVAAPVATQLGIVAQPAGAVDGLAFTSQPVIAIRDANGQTVPGATNLVSVSLAAGTGALSGTTTVAAVNGLATFSNLRITGTGAHTLAFTSTGLAGASSASFAVTVGAPAPPTQLAITRQPAGAASSVAFTTQPVVELRDSLGRLVTGATNAVFVTLASGTGVLSGATSVNAINGVATFSNLSIAGTGTFTLAFTAVGMSSATTTSFAVASAPGVALSVTTPPSGAVSGAPFTVQPVVTVVTATGATVAGATNRVTASISAGSGTLSGTTAVDAVNGVAAFTNLAITGSGTHTIAFNSTGLAGGAATLIVGTSGGGGGGGGTPGVPALLAVTVQPAGASSGLPFTTQPVVQVRDAAGTLVATATNPITAAIFSGTGALVGTTTVNAVAGVATFTDLRIGGSGPHTLLFISPALASTASSSFTVTQTPTQLLMTVQPSDGVSGDVLPTQPVVRVADVATLAVAGNTAAVTAAIASGTGVLSGTTTVNAVNGVATFTNLVITGTGTYTLSFTSSSLTSASSAPIHVNAAPATKLAVTTQPAGATSGAALTTQPVVTIQSASGATATAATNNVTAALSGCAATLSGTTTVAAVNGIATFTNLVISGSGSCTLAFSATGLTGATSTPLAVTQVPTALVIRTQPAGAVTGSAFTTQPIVWITDGAGLAVVGSSANVTASIAGGSGALSGTTTVAAVNGVATFTNLVITGTGAHTLSFASTGVTGATSGSLTVAAAPATQLAVTTQPAGAVSGSVFTTQPVIAVRDANGNLVAGATNSVTASIASGTGTLSGTTTVAAVNGVATFTDLKVAGSGAHTIVFAATGLTSATSSSFTVTQVATSLSVATQPSGAVTGTVFTTQPVVRILDGGGVVTAGATNVVTASIGSGSGTLSGTLTATAVNGVATFTDLKITGTGAHVLSFTATGVSGVTSASFSVTAAPPTQLAVTTQPSGAVSGSAFTTQPVVAIRDVNGNLVAGATNNVTAAIASGTGTLSGTVTVAAVNGVATFTNLQIAGAGAHTLAFTATSLTSATSSSFTVTQTPTSLAITTQPAGAVSGIVFTTQPVVQIRDGAGVLIAGATNAVTASIAGGSGALSGTTTVAAVNGVATFTNLKITGTGSHTLTFSATSLTSATSSAFSVTAAPPTQLAVTTQPSGAVSGSIFTTQPVVAVRDVNGAVVAGATNSVTASIASGTGTLSGTTTVAAVNGVATFTDLKIAGAGAHTIAFASSGLTGATSSSLTVSQVATSLAIGTQPSGSVTGTAFTTQPVIQILDGGGVVMTGATNVVTASVSSGTGTLGGTLTATAVNGIATFTNLKITGTGAHTLAFSASGLSGATSSSFTVTAAPVTQLAITTQPTGAVSGSAFTTQPVIELRDANGLVVAGATSVVTAAIAGGTGTLSGTLTATAVNGVATFTNLKIAGAGTHTIIFTATGLTSATSASFTVTQVATSLSVSTQPSGAVTGSVFTTQPVVQILDGGGVVTAGATNVVTASIGSGSGTLSGTLTATAVNGVATFTDLKITGTGSHVLSFTATGVSGVTSASFSVTAAPATQLAITTQPSGAVSGSVFTTQPVVAVRDANGLVVAGAVNSVTASIASGTGTLTGTTTVAAVNGVATFTNLKIAGSGAHTIAFAASGLSSATSSSFTVTQVATALSVSTQPAGAVTGSVFTTQPVVQVLDGGGVVTAGATHVVTASIGSGSGTLSGTLTATAVNGVATFTDLRITGTGSHVLSFTATGLSGVTSASFSVTAAPPTQLAITTQPSGAVSGTAFTTQPIVAIRDVNGNLVAGATNNVTASVASGTGALTGTVTVAAVNGVATFTNLKIAGAGAHTITFAASGLTSATSSSFTVTQVSTSLAIATQPSGAVTGSAFTTQPVVQILDGGGVLTAGATNVVTASIAGGSGTLSGTVAVAAVNGVATFTDLKITGTGAHTLTFSATSLASATSSSFTVSQVPTALAITTQPSGAVSGSVFTTQPVVEIRDGGGTIITTATNVVTAAIGSGSGTLSGTLTATAVNGVATFTNLKIAGAGAHTLTFTASGLTSATSSSFTVTQTAASLAIATQPAGAVSGTAFTTQPVVQIRDGGGVLISSATNAVTAAIGSGSGTLSGTTTVAAVNGVATFTDLKIAGSGAHTITFTATSLTGATSSSFTVTQTATALAITTQPSGAASGTAFTTQPVIEIRDAGGVLITGATSVVTAAIASGSGTLSGTTTATAVAGVATFTNLKISGSGAHTLTFTATSLTSATSSSFTVTQVPTSLTITTQPSGAVSGSVFTTQPVVQVRDAAGLLITTATNSVTAAIATGTGTLSGTVTTSAVAGVATFTNLKIAGSGAHTMVFSASGLTSTTSSSFTVSQTAASLSIATQPSGAASGTIFTTQPVVQILDGGGVVMAGAVNSVTAAIASGSGTLSGTTTVAAVNGVATFTDLKIAGTGAHTLTFTATSLTSTTSSSFTVTQVATLLGITTQPSGAVSGSVFTTQPVVEIRDGAGVLMSGATNTVTAAIASGTGTLSGTVAVAAVNGVATFTNLKIAGSGAHTITFSATGLTAATSSSFTVSQVATALAVTTQPAGAVSGTAFTTQPVVQIRDGGGTIITTATNVVTAAIGSGSGTLSGTLTATAVNGVATFTNLKISGAGAHTLTFAAAGLTSATSSSFTVTQTATALAITTQPSGAASGTAFTTQPVVEIRDGGGVIISSATNVVTAAIASGSGTLSGTTTATAVNGVATFTNLRITGTGAHTLTFTATSLSSATSSSFTVTQVATSLAISTQPAGAVSGTAFTTQPVVQIKDAGGLLISSATNSVTAAIASGTGTLSGTTTVAAVNGVATFTNLAITGSGAHTLTFTSTGLTSATSSSLTVSSGSGVTSITVTLGSSSLSGNNTTAATAKDQSNNTITNSVTWTSSNPLVARVSSTGGVTALGAGTSSITATSGAVTGSATVTVTAATGLFNIEVRTQGTMTASQTAAFTAAATRWMNIIRNDVTAQTLSNLELASCNNGTSLILNETIDDVVIYAKVEAIDGVGGVLASAGPCVLRSSTNANPRIPIVGFMRFDSADLANLEANGQMTDVVTHEMGHVLGFGSIWTGTTGLGLLSGSALAGGTDPTFTGGFAQYTFPYIVSGFAGAIVPVEETGGSGTADSHWRETVLDHELMTGYAEATGISMPLSALTIASMKDLGYVVDFSQADVGGVPSIMAPMRIGFPRTRPDPKTRINEMPMPAPIEIGADGRPTAPPRGLGPRRLPEPTSQPVGAKAPVSTPPPSER